MVGCHGDGATEKCCGPGWVTCLLSTLEASTSWDTKTSRLDRPYMSLSVFQTPVKARMSLMKGNFAWRLSM